MLSRILSLLNECNISLCGTVPLSSCRITKPHLLERTGISAGSVVIFAIPYYSAACDGIHNISAYAIAKDYHLFVKGIGDFVLNVLQTEYPSHKFAMFADHSPINERDTAARAGLGVIGKNGLLITKDYSSYVFLGELITDAILSYQEHPVSHCHNCGACAAACPYQNGKIETCLSALTQKKGTLTEKETAFLRDLHTVWGCDICSEVCPYTKAAKDSGSIYSPIPFFNKDTLPYLTASTLAAMSEKDFACRAYSWRGRETIERNLTIAEGVHECRTGNQTPQKATATGEKKE